MVCLSLSVLGGQLRLQAYRQLDRDFTFRLASPSKLVQSGIYAYIQHPSYIGGVLLIFCYSGLIIRTDGVLSCLMVNPFLSIILRGVVYLNCLHMVGGVVFSFPPRIRQEEALLRQTFGHDWEVYHGKTARFIPFLV